MGLSDESIQYFINIIQDLQANNQLNQMHQFIQHGTTSTYIHCLAVAYTSYKLTYQLPFQFDRNSVVRGAMLHDFYLYDWHIPHKSHRLHGFYHPGFALNNAKKHYKISPIEEDIICKHMWPLTITRCPKYRESILVCIVDKLSSLSEIFRLPTKTKEFHRIRDILSNSISK